MSNKAYVRFVFVFLSPSKPTLRKNSTLIIIGTPSESTVTQLAKLHSQSWVFPSFPQLFSSRYYIMCVSSAALSQSGIIMSAWCTFLWLLPPDSATALLADLERHYWEWNSEQSESVIPGKTCMSIRPVFNSSLQGKINRRVPWLISFPPFQQNGIY